MENLYFWGVILSLFLTLVSLFENVRIRFGKFTKNMARIGLRKSVFGEWEEFRNDEPRTFWFYFGIVFFLILELFFSVFSWLSVAYQVSGMLVRHYEIMRLPEHDKNYIFQMSSMNLNLKYIAKLFVESSEGKARGISAIEFEELVTKRLGINSN